MYFEFDDDKMKYKYSLNPQADSSEPHTLQKKIMNWTNLKKHAFLYIQCFQVNLHYDDNLNAWIAWEIISMA